MELIVPSDSQSGSLLYERIYQYIEDEIRLARLGVGNRPPSIRALTQNLRMSRSIMQMAYDQSLPEGYIEVLPCKGYYMCKIEELVGVRQRSPGSPVVEQEPGGRAYEMDFSPRGIDLGSFPFNIWREFSRNALVNNDKDMFVVGNPQGEPSLRAAARAYLHSAREVNCSLDQILIGAGSEYPLVLSGQILGNDLGNDPRIAMEDPTCKQVYCMLRGMGYSVVPVEVDRYRMNVDRLSHNRARVTYIMPSHQYPTGTVTSVKRRQELLAWAYNSRGCLIEDDYDNEFRYKGMSILALQGMGRGGRVIYMGTFLKSVASATRVGFMVLSRHLMEEYREQAGFYVSTVSRIDQSILYRPITRGYYERHLNCMRAVYKGKHDVLLTRPKDLKDRFVINGGYTGLHTLLTSKRKGSETQLVERAAAAGVKVCAASDCFINSQHDMDSSMVMLGYARLSERETERGIKLLDQVWEKLERGSEKRSEI